MSRGGVISLLHNRKSVSDTYKSYICIIIKTNVRRNCSVKNVHLCWGAGIRLGEVGHRLLFFFFHYMTLSTIWYYSYGHVLLCLKKLKQEAKGCLFYCFCKAYHGTVLKQPMNVSAGGMLTECAAGSLGRVIWFFSGLASWACIPYSHRGLTFG